MGWWAGRCAARYARAAAGIARASGGRIEHRAPLRHARQGGAHQAGRRLLLVAPAHDDRPVADQEDEGLGRLLRRELQRAADQAAVLAVGRRPRAWRRTGRCRPAPRRPAPGSALRRAGSRSATFCTSPVQPAYQSIALPSSWSCGSASRSAARVAQPAADRPAQLRRRSCAAARRVRRAGARRCGSSRSACSRRPLSRRD